MICSYVILSLTIMGLNDVNTWQTWASTARQRRQWTAPASHPREPLPSPVLQRSWISQFQNWQNRDSKARGLVSRRWCHCICVTSLSITYAGASIRANGAIASRRYTVRTGVYDSGSSLIMHTWSLEWNRIVGRSEHCVRKCSYNRSPTQAKRWLNSRLQIEGSGRLCVGLAV